MHRPRLSAPSSAAALALTLLAPLSSAAFPTGSQAQPSPDRDAEEGLPTIGEKTAGMERMDGYFPLYWDAELGKIWMEIAIFGTELLHSNGVGAGLGSNDIGIDRGALAGSRIVEFERVGRKILMVQPNYGFRASSDNPSRTLSPGPCCGRSRRRPRRGTRRWSTCRTSCSATQQTSRSGWVPGRTASMQVAARSTSR